MLGIPLTPTLSHQGRGSLRRALILSILYIHVCWRTLDPGSMAA